MTKEEALDLISDVEKFYCESADEYGYYCYEAESVLNEIYDSFKAHMKAKYEEIERLKSYVDKLWQILDDIDTYGDMAKSDDVLFRSLVEKKQKERWELPITTDGYRLIYKDNE